MTVRPMDLQVLFQQEPNAAKIRQFQKQFHSLMRMLRSFEIENRSRELRTPPIDALQPRSVRVTRARSSPPIEEREAPSRTTLLSAPASPEEKGGLLDIYAGGDSQEGEQPPDALLREKGHLRDHSG